MGLKNGNSWTTPSMNSILGLPRTVVQNKNKTSHWKRWNRHWENSKTSSRRRRGLSTTCKNTFLLFLSSCPHCQLLPTYLFYNKLTELWLKRFDIFRSGKK